MQTKFFFHKPPTWKSGGPEKGKGEEIFSTFFFKICLNSDLIDCKILSLKLDFICSGCAGIIVAGLTSYHFYYTQKPQLNFEDSKYRMGSSTKPLIKSLVFVFVVVVAAVDVVVVVVVVVELLREFPF